MVRLRSRNMSNISFRVFIADQHINKNVYNKPCWHVNINVEPYRVRRNARHQLNIRNRESKEIGKRQHSSNDITHRASNKSWVVVILVRLVSVVLARKTSHQGIKKKVMFAGLHTFI